MSEENKEQVEFIPRNKKPKYLLARPDEVLPDTLQLIPLTSEPYFPVLVQPIVVEGEPWGDVDQRHRIGAQLTLIGHHW